MTKGTVSGIAGADRMMSWRTYGTGLCLQAVDRALQKPLSDRPGFYTYALRALETVPAANRHYDRTPPKGAIVFFSAGRNGYGHICISVGGGNVVSTDIPSSGRVGVTSIAAIEKAWGRKFLCWTNWVMGYNVTTAKPAAPAGGATKHVTVNRPLKDIQRVVGTTQDGIWGPKTEAAVKAFQSRHGLTADGIWGPKSDAAGFPPATPAPAGSALIRAVQQKLKSNYPLYAGSLVIDGIQGPKTTAAIKEFQRRSGLTADGIVGPRTRKALGV